MARTKLRAKTKQQILQVTKTYFTWQNPSVLRGFLFLYKPKLYEGATDRSVAHKQPDDAIVH